MQRNELVSVIIPTNNRASLVTRAVESVLRQTYSIWELLIINDGSTDNTQEVISPFLRDKRISLFTLRSNVGAAAARNYGIEKARGKFIAFLDDDDEWLSDKLEKQLKIFNDSKEIAIVSCNYFSDGIENKKLSGSVSLDDLLFKNVLGSFSFCITKKAFVGNLRIEPTLKACQDWDLWVMILQKTELKGYIHENCLVHYNDLDRLRLTKYRKDSLNSYLVFLRKNWPIMNEKQRLYNLAVLTSRKNYIKNEDLLYKMKLSVKAIKYYIRSSYHFNVLDVFRYLGHALSGYGRLFKILRSLDEKCDDVKKVILKSRKVQ